MFRALTISVLLLFLAKVSVSQVVKGVVIDESGTGIPGVNISVVGKEYGTSTNAQGSFSFEEGTIGASDTLTFSHIGFYTRQVPYSQDNLRTVQLKERPFNAGEVVISASRFDETLLEAPTSIMKLNSYQIENASSGDFYKEIGKLKEVQVLSNSLTFNVFNARGFNTSTPYRVVQMADGMDLQSPGLNFSPGNMLGVPELDLQSMEVITGPASALYGSNALQGVLTMTSKDPFMHQGVSAIVKGGSRDLLDLQVRFSKAFGKKERIAIKLTGSYFMANDWVANDPVANGYFPASTPPVNLNQMVSELDNSGDQNYSDFNNYATTNSQVLPNVIPVGTQFVLPAYNESELFDGKVNSAKAGITAHYKLTDKTRVVWTSRFAQATGVYQGNNRAALKNFYLHQHKLEVSDERFSVRAYTTFEDAADSYDLVLTGINAGFAGLAQASSSYLSTYVGVVDSLSSGFNNPLTQEQIDIARSLAQQSAQSGFLNPNSDVFASVVNSVVSNPDRPTGGRYTDRSNMQHVEAQYNLRLNFLTANFGASWRRFDPISDGNIMSDTLNSDGHRTDISYMEYAGFVQLRKPLFKNKLRLHASVRFDKSQNFKLQVSPRGAITFNHKGHYIRASYQTAFRTPTLSEQYFFLNVGPLIVRGNITGYENLYTQSSVDEYLSAPPPLRDPVILEPLTIDPLRPERLNTIEIGYKYLFKDRLYLDVAVYHNTYSGFIGSINAVEPTTGSATDSTGVAAVDTRQYTSYSISANAKQDVSTLGASIGLKYSVLTGLNVGANYTFSHIFDKRLDDNLIPGFNTPPHRFNITATGRRLYKGLGFSLSFSWVDSYNWESPFSTRAAKAFGLEETSVPSYHTLDVQLVYELNKIYSTFRVGASNVYNNRHVEVWGGPKIGALVYASWLFDFGFN
ncbi:MAG: carboxypeptidase-like regulatory domain-containing protein [Flavobacteriales bacterium]|nr:carboxypeptidase-like regulatory domain-containing protein [Flavobacteriales bacterium]MCB9190278.1 carboxypeptidase-like regulatory domain-containing protein [Flavobacteriales bacterium]